MKFRYLGDPLFLVCCAFYCVNRWMLKPWVESAFLQNWFNDLLLVPCAVPVVFAVFRVLGLRENDAPPSALDLVWIVAAWALLFEWAGPLFVAGATGDWMDVAMYCAGAVAAWMFWRQATIARAGR